MIESIKNTFSFPAKCLIEKKLHKKIFYDNAINTKTAEKQFKDYVDSVLWLYTLKPETTNIKPFVNDTEEYEEIQLLYVELKVKEKYKNIAEIIQNSMPYPLIIIFSIENTLLINVVSKRKNLADISKLTTEEMYFTQWITLEESDIDKQFFTNLHFQKLTTTNLKTLYMNIIDLIRCRLIAEYSNKFTIYEKDELEKCYSIYQKIKYLEGEIATMKVKIKQKGFSEQVSLNVEIKKKEQELDKMIEGLKNV